MKTSTIVTQMLLVFLLCTGFAAAGENGKKYDSNKSYQGQYLTDRVYHRPPIERSPDREWLDRESFESTRRISCSEARATLNVRGLWSGNLDGQGNCLDPGEPTEWATGNYINYLSGADE